VHTAKEMLHAFHAEQTRQNPGSVHASYMLTGYRAEKNNDEEEKEEEDTIMESSPFEAHQEKLVRTVMVVSEEKLAGTSPYTHTHPLSFLL
jgi:hypothetical protein